MSTPTEEAFLICDDATGPAATNPSDQPGAPPGRTPDAGAADPYATEPPFDPSRWVMVGWRDAKGAPPVTWQQLTAILSGPQGPCARCGTPHHRYGVGGQPLCPACRPPRTGP